MVGVPVEQVRELVDGDHDDEAEEELQPARVPLFGPGLGQVGEANPVDYRHLA